MAGRNENLKDAGQKDSPAAGTAVKKPVPEAVYAADEVVRAAQEVFPGVRRECVMAAFKVAGVKTATLRDAKKLVGDFCKKEVQ